MDMKKRVLERAGFEVRCTTGIDRARELLKDFTPDAIMLGCELPGRDSVEYLKELAAKSIAPIMYISNNRDDEVPALKAGANDFLKRPFDFDVLITRMNFMVNAGRKSRSATNIGGAAERQPGKPRRWDSKQTETQAEPGGASETAEGTRTEATPIKKDNPLGFGLVAAACLVLILVGAIMMMVLYNRPLATSGPDSLATTEITEKEPDSGDEVFIEDELPPLSEFPFQTAQNVSQPAGMIDSTVYPNIKGAVVPASETNISLGLENDISNRCNFVFEVRMKVSGETICRSEMLAPGTRIDCLATTRTLEKGEYEAALYIFCYSLIDEVLLGGVNESFRLNVS